jgi:hypothetical protein
MPVRTCVTARGHVVDRTGEFDSQGGSRSVSPKPDSPDKQVNLTGKKPFLSNF